MNHTPWCLPEKTVMTAIPSSPLAGSNASPPLITLNEAPQHVSGRPSISAVWRWCRRGVLARNGQRIRLEHRRIGGKIYTSAAWLHAFTKALTDADEAYFRAKQDASNGATPRAAAFDAPNRPRNRRRIKSPVDPDQPRRVANELDGEGL